VKELVTIELVIGIGLVIGLVIGIGLVIENLIE